MHWIAIFSDEPEMLKIRTDRRRDHHSYLRQHEAEILVGGGFRSSPDEPLVGGLWIMDVESRERAVELIENDPYFHPEYRNYSLYVWGKALEDREVVI